jgi:hypothetical protein
LWIAVTLGFIAAGVCLWKDYAGRRRKGTTTIEPSQSRTVHPYLLQFAFIVPYYLVIGTAEVKFLRYTIPLLPPFLILLSTEAVRLWDRIKSHDPSGGTGKILLGVGGLIGLYTLLYASSFTRLLAQPTTQDQAGAWLLRNASGQTVGLTTVPWFYSPPVSPYNGGPQSARAFEIHRSESPFRLEVLGMDPDRLARVKPRYVVLSEFETADILRLASDPRERANPDLMKSVRFLDRVRAEYQIVYQARNRPSALPARLLPSDAPPHDWLYPYPVETVWKRR